MKFPQQYKFNPQRKPRLPKPFLIIPLLILSIIAINYITFGSISATLHLVGEPIWKSQAGIINIFQALSVSFKDKQELQAENDRLRGEITQLTFSSIGMNALRQENKSLRELLNRETVNERIVATILARPNRTLYDTFVVDVGRRNGVSRGDRVFVVGEVAVGFVAEVYSRTSLIDLYSTPGRSTEVFLGEDSVAADAIGLGGGDFEVRIPRGVEVLKGHIISSAGFDGGVFGVIEEIIALPADSFQTILFSSPVNMQSLRIVTIELQ